LRKVRQELRRRRIDSGNHVVVPFHSVCKPCRVQAP
jgi:hypothetical protein